MKPSMRKQTASSAPGIHDNLHNAAMMNGAARLAAAEGSGRPGKSSRKTATPEPSVVNESAADAADPVDESIGFNAAEAFIESKRIGDRIKFLRQRKQMGLVELGRHTGLSASFLSQLETGRVVPTLRNLARVAMVFSKDLSYFFEPERPELFRILRGEDRQRLPQSGVEEPGYYFESLGHVPSDHSIVPYVAEFLPADERRPVRSHRHAGAEFLFVLSGCLQLTHDGRSDNLDSGDAVYFNTESPHSYARLGEDECAALILTMPEPLRGHHTGTRIPAAREAASRGETGRVASRRN